MLKESSLKQVDHTLPIAAGQVDLNKADYEVVH
jgi:hypothetical protein